MYPEGQKKFKGPVYLHLVRGGGQACIFLYPLGLLPVRLGFFWWTSGSPPCAFDSFLGSLNGVLEWTHIWTQTSCQLMITWWLVGGGGCWIDMVHLVKVHLEHLAEGHGYRCLKLTSGRAVDHNILLPRLEHTIYIKCFALLWFESCLIDLNLFMWMCFLHTVRLFTQFHRVVYWDQFYLHFTYFP